MARVSGTAVGRWAFAANFRGSQIITMTAIARAESGWNTTARNLTAREDSRGLWQINVRAHPWGRRINLYSGPVNARAAWVVWRGAGNSFRPWSVYLHGTYIRYLPAAWQATRGISGVTEASWVAARNLAFRVSVSQSLRYLGRAAVEPPPAIAAPNVSRALGWEEYIRASSDRIGSSARRFNTQTRALRSLRRNNRRR